MAKIKKEENLFVYRFIGYILFLFGLLALLFDSKLVGGIIGICGYFQSRTRTEKVLNTILAIVGLVPTLIVISIMILQAIQSI